MSGLCNIISWHPRSICVPNNCLYIAHANSDRSKRRNLHLLFLSASRVSNENGSKSSTALAPFKLRPTLKQPRSFATGGIPAVRRYSGVVPMPFLRLRAGRLLAVRAVSRPISIRAAASMPAPPKHIVVVGNGMVGLNFIEKIVKADTEGTYKVTHRRSTETIVNNEHIDSQILRCSSSLLLHGDCREA